MSTYLLAFVVGEFDHVSAMTKHGVVIRVYCPPGKPHLGSFALQCAQITERRSRAPSGGTPAHAMTRSIVPASPRRMSPAPPPPPEEARGGPAAREDPRGAARREDPREPNRRAVDGLAPTPRTRRMRA